MGIFAHKIDKNSVVPLYYQLKEIIMSEIKNGSYKEDSILPTENEISQHFAISRNTVRQAISMLVQEGWLYRVKSKGTFVTCPQIDQGYIQKIESYKIRVSKDGMKARTEVIDMKVIEADEKVAEKLQIAKAEKVIQLSRLRFANEKPMAYIDTYMSLVRCGFILDYDFAQESLYKVLQQDIATEVKYVNRLIRAVPSKEIDFKYMHISKEIPIQLITSVGFNVYDVPIEYSEGRYRGDLNSFIITVFPSQDEHTEK